MGFSPGFSHVCPSIRAGWVVLTLSCLCFTLCISLLAGKSVVGDPLNKQCSLLLRGGGTQRAVPARVRCLLHGKDVKNSFFGAESENVDVLAGFP